ncbi:helix-turn-helix domain-containing protein [Micromonospora sp. NBC_01813]|uniref:helix-turn-helix domain-containing protein n=1 Tax=Micromonospora sp. NBC_01813 TaxID=2975988 RepID=UPI002DD82404|nr:helix-turn-helix transcriptional regulator [Micromonospora sp. NBC_01813]WSA12187.1 helix-turn-helix transcriptional regulator [Micromonospora sp. NBC_01813]
MSELQDLLRRERTKRNLTQVQVGEAIRISNSAIGGFETGKLIPTDGTAADLDRLYETGKEIQRLATAAREEAQAPWLRSWLDNERRALVLRSFQPLVLPGLLQTEAYARAVLATGPRTRRRLDEAVAVRLERQSATLERDENFQFTGIVAESVLRQPGSFMKDQLEHLVDIGHRPEVQIRVLPADVGMHPGVAGAFVVAVLPGDRRIGYLDDQLSGRVVTAADDVVSLEQAWDALSGLALTVSQSRDLMLRMIDERE